MSKIRVLEKRTGNCRYVGRGYRIGDNVVLATWGSAAQFKTEDGLQVSAHLRSQGLDATCISDSGGTSLEPQIEAAPVQHASVTWRGITPAEAPGGKWIHIFKDPDSQSNQLITGNSPIDVITKIQDLAGWDRETQALNRYAGYPVFSKYVASLPLDPGMTPEPSAPAFNQPAPRAIASDRVLRPADNRFQTLPERPVEQPRVASNAVFEAWEKTAPASVVKQRLLSDPAFAAWYGTVAAS